MATVRLIDSTVPVSLPINLGTVRRRLRRQECELVGE